MDNILSARVDVRSKKDPRDLLGETVTVVLDTSESLWFKIIEVGVDPENNHPFIKGYDMERRNRVFNIVEIDYIISRQKNVHN